MAIVLSNVDKIITSGPDSTEIDLHNLKASGGNTFKDFEIQGGATGTSQDSVEYIVKARTVLSGVNIVKFHVTFNGGSTVTLENGVTSGFNSSSYGYCPVSVPFNAAVGTDFVISATAEDDLGNVSAEFTKTVNLIANVKPTAPTAETFVKMSPSSLKNTQTVTFSGSTDTAGVGGSVVSYRVKNISDSVLTVDATTVDAGSAHTFRLAADATVSQYWTDNSLTNSKNATFDVVAVDNVGLESDPTQMQIEIDKNRPPTAPSSQTLTLMKEEESRTITFGGSVETDGSVVSYKVSNISDPCLTVANPIVNAGDPHQFTAGIRSVIETFLNGATEAQDVTFDVTAIDDLGMESPVTTMTIPVDIDRAGEAVFTSAGTYSWTAPAGITSISVVLVGGGGSGFAGNPDNGGGGGGGLTWTNDVPVVPGTSYAVVVGAAGAINGYAGGASSLTVGTATHSAQGGSGGRSGVGGAGGSGSGGKGGNGSAGINSAGGGGGAAGYTGDGGNGGPGPGSGGGAAGGYGGHAGGGVGIYGQGVSGGTSGGHPTSWTGEGGSGGTTGTWKKGGSYGGGGAGFYNLSDSKYTHAGGGAVRIIWGDGRSFPNNAA